jgi:hypothetical protein
MKYVKPLVCTLVLLGGCISLYAQDRIYRINPIQTIEGKIIEVGETYVRYTRTDTRDDVTFNLPVQYLRKIVFEDGKELVYNDVVDVSNDRKNAVKLGFLSPAWNSTTLYYERSLKAGQSLEFGFGVIGLGIEEWYDNESGFLIRAGYKFISRPEYYQSRFRYAHLLKGSYIKPEITYVNYKFDGDRHYALCDYEDYGGCNAPYFAERHKVSLLNFSIIGGKQWIFQNSFLLDLYTGIGFSVGDNENWDNFHYAFTGDTFTFTAGFKIGFLF